MFDIRENLKKLPDKPGVYLHKDKLGQVIYVGKAVSLKNRVRQYFQSPARLDPKTRAMVSHIEEFEYITTDTEMEALLLECNLIKKYMPKYNVLLRDDKTFPYIKLTVQEEWPRLIKTRKVVSDGARYFGPYTDAKAVNQIIDLLSGLYALKRCGAKSFPKGFRPCLNYHINQCRGICTGHTDRDSYMEAVKDVADFLNGRDTGLVEQLKARMAEKAAAMEYEEAAELRDQIAAVTAVTEKQKVALSTIADMDVLLTAGTEGNAQYGVVFYVRKGRLSGRESFPLPRDLPGDRQEVAAAFLKQYYSDMALIPKEILVDYDLADRELLEDWLSSLRGSRVKITRPQRGEKKALIDLARRDVIQMLDYLAEKAKIQMEKAEKASRALNEALSLSLPESGLRIEAYDISNTGGVDSVGAMVVFEDGRPLRKAYRRFKIKTVEGPDDTGSLQEVIYRRMKRGLSGDPGFDRMPHLILMDGGKNQVNAARQVLAAMKVGIPVAGMVKDDRHRTRGLILEEQEVELKGFPGLFHYIAAIQEEVHRFAIEYHRGLRTKKLQRSRLDEIEGVGEKRRNALLSHFGSIDEIAGASVEELLEAPGMNRKAAEMVKRHFESKEPKPQG